MCWLGNRRPWQRAVAFCLFAAIVAYPLCGGAYSVLSHEAIIDVVWATHIVPLLRKRFPNVTPEELRQAHAYAYGGAIIQDMGYYPYGSKFFSDLTHYVRSGDFIQALLRDASDINEYAFALASLSHYAADNEGHRLATNRAVPMLYPELRKKYGDEVTYEDNPIAHTKTEFGFDVLEVAKERYAPDAYRDFIGFEVAQPLLERAFKETYGLDLHAVLKEEEAIGSYRHAVSKTIPQASKIAWSLKQDDIKADVPGMTEDKFLYNLSRSSYEKRWGRRYQRPGPGARFLAFLFRLIPKIGPLKILTFRTPTPQAEKLFEASFNVILDRYRQQLTELKQGEIALPNDNFDVGKHTEPGEYHLNDSTYDELLHRLAEGGFAGVTPELRANIERFYSVTTAAQRSSARWARVQQELGQLKSTQPPASTSLPAPASRS